ncbi:MAG: hypothetical protein KME08_17450 [Aphanothece sp. CMT-3BRIN-NPC111]|jgi:hypothetical protein|nr:hypothetical protein [Aphanothece sp. CMT-3BRIN-NPC111]
MKTSLSLALVGGLLTLGCADLPPQSQAPSYAVQAQKKPIQLVGLTPGENATGVNPEVTVNAGFDFLRGQRPILPPSVQLLIDGVDVTPQSRLVVTDDIPSSGGGISFQPPQPFSTGKHVAEVRFANDQNQQFSYTWDFYVSHR